jgi:predicted phosphodiesterase
MTRLAILSDIHGNLPALEAVLDDLARFQIDQTIVAGDVINWGPFSAQVMQIVAREGWPVIRGNNEFYLLDYHTPRAPAVWERRDQFPMLPWLHRQLNGRWRAAIAAWPDALSLRFPDAPPIRVVHGSPRSNSEPIFPISTPAEIESMLAGVEETIVIAAHTHLAMDRQAGRWHILNPGTVGVPIDGVFGARYMILEGDGNGWRPTFRHIEYDDSAVFREFERQRFVEECGPIGHLVIKEFKTARLHLSPFLKWRAATCADEPISMDMLDAFGKADYWEYVPPAYRVNIGNP